MSVQGQHSPSSESRRIWWPWGCQPSGPGRPAHQAASSCCRTSHPLVDPFAVKNLDVSSSEWDLLCESWAQSPLLQPPELTS